jgi:hypothetical protein
LTGLREGFHVEPTLTSTFKPIERPRFDELLNTLARINLSVFARDEMLGLDGESFGVATLGIYHGAHVHWWSVHPKGWEPLAAWLTDAVAFLDGDLR